ncbi:MAG: efflux RND transporter periplasmic adaptor subunit [Blautia sp.]|nr:efflux RND transporter periplasmic adaptor subunit [Blautia sp.]
MKKRGIIITSVVLIAAALGGGGLYFYNNYIATEEKETAYVESIRSILGINAGVQNRYAGVVEPQETVEVKIESGRKVSQTSVKAGQSVKEGELLFVYDLSSIQEDLQAARLAYDRLVNEAMSYDEQIKTLEKEKTKAPADSQLSYTIEIETNKMNLKKNEYDQKSKAAEIEKLERATVNTEVRSPIDGIVQKIDTNQLNSEDGNSLDTGDDLVFEDSDSSGSGAFITILSTGAYRIKGKINELNIGEIIPGNSVIVRSRVDEKLIWRGIMGNVDMDSTDSNENNNSFGFMDYGSDSQTSSASYPFYVELDSSDGLMLGQHVLIEMDEGQEDKKDGLWLSEYYIVGTDTTDPYVWAANSEGLLEKRTVILGNYDSDLLEYEIVEGLTVDDKIAYPDESLAEGMLTKEGRNPEEEIVEDAAGEYEEYDYGYEYSDDYGLMNMEDVGYIEGSMDYDTMEYDMMGNDPMDGYVTMDSLEDYDGSSGDIQDDLYMDMPEGQELSDEPLG